MAIPVSMADARHHLRIEEGDTSQDAEIGDFIADAASWVQNYTGHILVARDIEERFAGFDRIRLLGWPIKTTAAVSVTYSTAGGSVPVVGARLSGWRRPMVVHPARGQAWPLVKGGEVIVGYRAGYEDGDAIPRNIRRAMLVLIAAYDADREGGETFQAAEATARKLCGDLRGNRL